MNILLFHGYTASSMLPSFLFQYFHSFTQVIKSKNKRSEEEHTQSQCDAEEISAGTFGEKLKREGKKHNTFVIAV